MHFPGMRAWYLRLDRFLSMAGHLERHHDCLACRNLLRDSHELSLMRVEDKKSSAAFEERYVVLMDKMTQHLKEHHDCRLPNHYLSLYTLLFMGMGTIIGLLGVWLARAGGMETLSWQMGGLLGFVTGLILGRIAGSRKDRRMRSDGKVLY